MCLYGTYNSPTRKIDRLSFDVPLWLLKCKKNPIFGWYYQKNIPCVKLSNFFNFFLKSLLIARARKSDFSPNQGFLRLSIAQFHKSSLLLKSVCLSTSPFVNIFSRPIFFAAHEWVGFQNGRWRRRRRRMTNSCRLMSEVFFCNLHKFYARTINFHVE